MWTMGRTSSDLKRPIAALAVASLYCLTPVAARAASLTRAEQTARWEQHIRGRPNPRILDDLREDRREMEVIERMVVIRQVKGLTPMGAALATVILQTCGAKATRPVLTGKVLLRFAAEWKGAELTDSEKEKLQKLHKKISAEFWRRHPGLRDRVLFDVTFGVRDAKLIQMTIRRSDSVAEALREIAWLQGLVPTLECGRDLPFSAYKEAIDKKIPILVELPGKGAYRVCFGYLVADGKEYLILADCGGVRFEKRPPHIAAEDLESDDPRVKQWVEREKKQLITSDYETGAGKPLSDGVEIVPFGAVRSATGYFVYGWRVSAEGLAKEIGGILKSRRDPPVPPWIPGGD